METLLEGADPREHEHGGYLCCLRLGSYFKITEEDLFARLGSTFMLRDLDETLAGQPDLYGPFWIASTLLFLLISSASVTRYLLGLPNELDFAAVAAGLIYGTSFATSYAIVGLTRMLGGQLPMVKTVCVYGYSMALWLPATLFCFIPNFLLQLILLCLALVSSVFFLLRNLLGETLKEGSQRTIVACLVVGSQALLALVYKFYFFSLS
jgi:hypothetical protein